MTQKTDEKARPPRHEKNTQEMQKDAGLEGQVTEADFLCANPPRGQSTTGGEGRKDLWEWQVHLAYDDMPRKSLEEDMACKCCVGQQFREHKVGSPCTGISKMRGLLHTCVPPFPKRGFRLLIHSSHGWQVLEGTSSNLPWGQVGSCTGSGSEPCSPSSPPQQCQ